MSEYTQQMEQRILGHIKSNPGTTNIEIAEILRMGYSNIKTYTGGLYNQQKLEYLKFKSAKKWYVAEDYHKYVNKKIEVTAASLEPTSLFNIVKANNSIGLIDLKQHTGLSVYKLEKMLNELIDQGKIVRLKKEKFTPSVYQAVISEDNQSNGASLPVDLHTMSRYLYQSMDMNRTKYPELRFNRPKYTY